MYNGERSGRLDYLSVHKKTLQQLGWAGLFLAPNLILVAVFTFIPAAGSLALSLAEWDVFSPPRFIGLDNYIKLLGDSSFWTATRNTFIYTMVTVPIVLAGSLLLALVLNKRLVGTLAFRTIFFIPVIMSGVLVSLTWLWLFNADYGPINYALAQIGIQGPDWLHDPRWALVSIMVVTIWKSLGFTMVIFLAALQDVPQSYYEAARIDGAAAWAEFRYITLPLISAAMFFALLISVIASFEVFDLVYLLTQGGPGRSSSVIVQYIYENAFKYFEVGYASSVATVFFAIVLVFTYFQWSLRRRWVFGEE